MKKYLTTLLVAGMISGCSVDDEVAQENTLTLSYEALLRDTTFTIPSSMGRHTFQPSFSLDTSTARYQMILDINRGTYRDTVLTQSLPDISSPDLRIHKNFEGPITFPLKIIIEDEGVGTYEFLWDSEEKRLALGLHPSKSFYRDTSD